MLNNVQDNSMDYFRIDELTKVLEFSMLRFKQHPKILKMETYHLWAKYKNQMENDNTFVSPWFIQYYDQLYCIQFINTYNEDLEKVILLEIKFVYKKFKPENTNLTLINSFIDDYIMSNFTDDYGNEITVNDYDLVEY